MSLDKCLKDLERIRRKALRRLAENCTDESIKTSTMRKINLHYEGARKWVREIYFTGMYVGKIDLTYLENYIQEDNLVGFFSERLIYHINRIKMLSLEN